LKPEDQILSAASMLEARYGDLNWWPGESRDEILIGAILTQNTSWENVEKSLSELRKRGMLDIRVIAETDENVLSGLIRSSGFYRIKAARLIAVCRSIAAAGGFESLEKKTTMEAEDFLLALNGIGGETAESILCYILGREVFVVDRYTTRIFSRLGMDNAIHRNYIRSLVEKTIKGKGSMKNFHATLVQLGKEHCRSRPYCNGCPLSRMCEYFQRVTSP
jgi:endonuclease-3 related protein